MSTETDLSPSGRSEPPGAHRWKFIRVGGVLQVVFRSGADIVNLEHLDQKLWVALACPVKGVEFDERTLELLDFDKDGRVRAPEVIQISRWIRDVVKNPDDLLTGGDTVSLSAVRDNTPDGTALLASFKRVIARSPNPQATTMSLAEITTLASHFATSKFNGDGVLPADSAPDEETKKLIEDVLATTGGVPDVGGKAGVNQAKLDAFFAEVEALLAWQKQAETNPAILPLGDKTADAVDSLKAVRTKIDDYFARTQLAAFDHRAAPILNRAEADLLSLATRDLRTDAQEIAQLPLARIEPGRPLPLTNGINPAWTAAVARFTTTAVTPVLTQERDSLTQQDWHTLQGKLAAYEQWIASKPATSVEKLGFARLRQLVGSELRARLSKLLADDLAEAPTSADFKTVEKLIRVQRDIFKFLNNFVSFSDFYSRRGAIFQAGTLYLDARSCDLCVLVADPAKHALLAGMSKAYLAYCDCTRVGGKKMTIAAAFTAGDSDNLMIGRNGVFYDRSGLDWDATITKIVDNPISIRQAFWSPYKKFVRMVEDQVAKRAAAAEASSQEKLGTAATTVATVDLAKPPQPTAPKPEVKKVDVGTVAAIGVALGSLATFLGLMFTKVVDLGWWAPFAILGIIFAISLPSMLIAWLKLRQRNLGPILDANGWAVNGRMKINVPFGGALSKLARLPRGAQVQLNDPFYESHAGRYTVIVLIALAIILGTLWRFEFLDRFLPASLQRKPTPVILAPVVQTPVVAVPSTNLPATVSTNQ